jgi:hypothetical protein
MKVFIMWSGERSRMVAEALKSFLEAAIAAPRYFMSKDIGAGEVWRNVIAGPQRRVSPVLREKVRGGPLVALGDHRSAVRLRLFRQIRTESP